MPYPVIMNGDHADFEREWAASGRPDIERPDWPLPSFDAQDWADAFCKACRAKGFSPSANHDQDWVQGWFSNALMRGFDEHAARHSRRARLDAYRDELTTAITVQEKLDLLIKLAVEGLS